ncbi:hypothetical protein EDB86DRAFT_2962554, partial [Lactarius hatsudake]
MIDVVRISFQCPRSLIIRHTHAIYACTPGFHSQAWSKLRVHWIDQSELVSYFTQPKTDNTDADLSKQLTDCVEISGFKVSVSASAPGKRTKFAFHCRICDDSAFAVVLPGYPLLQYATVTKIGASVIHNLVWKWTEEWFMGGGARWRSRGHERGGPVGKHGLARRWRVGLARGWRGRDQTRPFCSPGREPILALYMAGVRISRANRLDFRQPAPACV